jgi:hypothetical protein
MVSIQRKGRMHMLHRHRRLAARLLAVSLLAATLYAVDALAAPSPAEARCKGVNTPVYSWFSPGEGVAASETPGTGTCNNNNIYSAVVKDEKADGYCVWVLFRETGTPWRTVGSRVCGKGNTTTIQYEDFNGNSRADQKFCLQTLNPPYESICGWGNSIEGYALNWGY